MLWCLRAALGSAIPIQEITAWGLWLPYWDNETQSEWSGSMQKQGKVPRWDGNFVNTFLQKSQQSHTYTYKKVCALQLCRSADILGPYEKSDLFLKWLNFYENGIFSSLSHLRNVQWKAAAEMLNLSFSKKAHWLTVHYIVLELKESRTKTHFHYFGGINVHAMPQYLQCLFLATKFTVFLKFKVNQKSTAIYFSFYWSLQWRCQNTVSRVWDTSRSRRVINQMESN